MTTPLAEIPPPKLQFFDTNGDPLVGGLVYTYAAGTTTKVTTWTDSTQLTPNTNPIILDARGECSIWVPPSEPITVDAGIPGPPGPIGPEGPPGAAGLPCSITTWTTEQLLTLNTPGNVLELVPAIADLILIPVAILFQGIPGDVPFTTCGDWHITYDQGDSTFPNVAISPSTDIMTSLDTRVDYALLTSPMYGFRADASANTWALTNDVVNKPIVLWSLDGAWDGSGGVDQGLMVTVYYVAQGESLPEPVVPNNDAYASDAGCIEIQRETYFNNTGFDLPASFNSFRSLPITFDYSSFIGNEANPEVISQTAGLYRAEFPCWIEIEAKLFGTPLQVPYSCTVAITYTGESNFWAQSAKTTGAVGSLELPGFRSSVFSGPFFADWHDQWDGNFNIDEVTGVAGDLFTITSVELSSKVIQVVGRIDASTVHTAGVDYAIGDYVQVNTGYIRAILRIDTVDGGGEVLTYTVIDPGRGFRAASPISTTAITGIGTGFYIAISAVNNSN